MLSTGWAHVGRGSAESCFAPPEQEDQERGDKHVEALHLRVGEYREELTLAKQDSRRMKKALKAAEV
jgi:hypothetical protein